MQAGEIALVAPAQADGLEKLRPALLLCTLPPFDDWLACGISSQVHQAVPDFDEIVASGDEDFAGRGLRVPSVIRLGFLGAFAGARFEGSIGRIGESRLRRFRERLARRLNSAS
jgi:mRNA interferase MazF